MRQSPTIHLKMLHAIALTGMLFLSLVLLGGCGGSGSDAAEVANGPIWVQTSYVWTRVNTDGSYNASLTYTMTLDEQGNALSCEITGYDFDWTNELKYAVDEDGWTTMEAYPSLHRAAPTTYELEKDETGRVVKSTASNRRTTTYTYDEAGNFASKTEKGTYTAFDDNGEDHEEPYTSVVTYNADGLIAKKEDTLADGTETIIYTYEYDDAGRAVSGTMTSTGGSDGNWTGTLSFEYDENGNLSRKVEQDNISTNTYEYTYTLVEDPSLATRLQSHLV